MYTAKITKKEKQGDRGTIIVEFSKDGVAIEDKQYMVTFDTFEQVKQQIRDRLNYYSSFDALWDTIKIGEVK